MITMLPNSLFATPVFQHHKSDSEYSILSIRSYNPDHPEDSSLGGPIPWVIVVSDKLNEKNKKQIQNYFHMSNAYIDRVEVLIAACFKNFEFVELAS